MLAPSPYLKAPDLAVHRQTDEIDVSICFHGPSCPNSVRRIAWLAGFLSRYGSFECPHALKHHGPMEGGPPSFHRCREF